MTTDERDGTDPRVLVVDIETVASPATLAMAPTEDFLLRGVQERFKDETVQRYREENAAAWPAEVGKLGALDWRRGEVVSVGLYVPRWRRLTIVQRVKKHLSASVCAALREQLVVSLHKDMGWSAAGSAAFYEVVVMTVDDGAGGGSGEQRLLLKVFDEMRASGVGHAWQRMVGFNHRNFDLPWLRLRGSLLCGEKVKPLGTLNAARYSTSAVVDWSDLLSSYGAFPMTGWSLEQYAVTFGLRGLWGNGADMGTWWADEDYFSMLRHLAGDLLVTNGLNGLFAPAFGLPVE